MPIIERSISNTIDHHVPLTDEVRLTTNTANSTRSPYVYGRSVGDGALDRSLASRLNLFIIELVRGLTFRLMKLEERLPFVKNIPIKSQYRNIGRRTRALLYKFFVQSSAIVFFEPRNVIYSNNFSRIFEIMDNK